MMATTSAIANANVLEFDGFGVQFSGNRAPSRPLLGLTLSLAQGSSLGIVGESGSGKTVSMLAAFGLLPNAITTGTARFQGRSLTELSPLERRKLLGREIGMVFQEPMTALDPLMRIDEQIAEGLVAHGILSPRAALQQAIELLDHVGIIDPQRCARCLPHELSGGMRQRVGIAIAIACEPQLLIADEPTAALDVTVQAQILELLANLRRKSGMAMVLISHDLGVVSQVTDQVAVLYAGRLLEHCATADLFSNPQHPYTIGLLGALPNRGGRQTLYAIEGAVPSPDIILPGCRFAPRCVAAAPICLHGGEPSLRELASNHHVACHRAPLENSLQERS